MSFLDNIKDQLYMGKNKPYLRPYVSKCSFEEAKLLLVGINPATPIMPSNENGLDKYFDALKDPNAFQKMYEAARNGNTSKSRTRIGIETFVEHMGVPTIETNVITYPTHNLKELKKVAAEDIKKSKTVFYELLKETNATVMVIHGKRAFDELLTLLDKKEYGFINGCNESMKINELEEHAPALNIYIKNKTIKVFPVRHFMYYGKTGESFSSVKQRIKATIK